MREFELEIGDIVINKFDGFARNPKFKTYYNKIGKIIDISPYYNKIGKIIDSSPLRDCDVEFLSDKKDTLCLNEIYLVRLPIEKPDYLRN